MKSNNVILFICGPTGVGKTDFSYQLGKYLPIEIINADVGQFYSLLSIGTAKPDITSNPVRHHLFDVVSEPRDYSVSEYRKAFLDILSGIWSRQHIPIVVGGSGFYVKSLLFPPGGNMQKQGSNKKPEASDIYSWDKLFEVDPERARSIHPHDMYRIQRALSTWYATGTIPSLYKEQFVPLAMSHIFLFLERERKNLYNIIDQRVYAMLESGWVNELYSLTDEDWYPFLQKKKLIGYPTVINYIKKNISYSDMVTGIQVMTKQYAKKQITFFRSFAQLLGKTEGVCVKSHNLTLFDPDLYIKQIVKLITG